MLLLNKCLKMRTEIPVFKRCCCCLPLRRGLLLWAYIKLVIGMIAISSLSFEVFFIIRYVSMFSGHAGPVIRFLLAFALLLASCGVNILLIVAAHKKSSKLLRLAYICELVAVLSVFVMLVSLFVHDVITYWDYISDLSRSNWKSFIFCYLTFAIYVGVQLYIVASIRSEVIKLESKHEFRFVNHAVDAECEYYENKPPVDSATKVQDEEAHQ